jgi:hypothetical protein
LSKKIVAEQADPQFIPLHPCTNSIDPRTFSIVGQTIVQYNTQNTMSDAPVDTGTAATGCPLWQGKALRLVTVCVLLASWTTWINLVRWKNVRSAAIAQVWYQSTASSGSGSGSGRSATFSGFQTFGPRARLEAGHSAEELWDCNSSIPLSFYRSKDVYYAAAWLSTLETFLCNPRFVGDPTDPSYNPNLEAGTFAGIVGRKNYRTVDMLDFMVHHLSHYKLWFHYSVNRTHPTWKHFLGNLQSMQQEYDQEHYNNPNLQRNGQTLVLIPFSGASDRHSRQDEKQLYLNLTVKTIASIFPNIVVSVFDQQNYDYVVHQSGLNEYLWDVLQVRNLTMRQHLPHQTSVQARKNLLPGGRWEHAGFEFVYYTEADQIPHLKNLDALLKQTLQDNHTVVVPHRSLPVPVELPYDSIRATLAESVLHKPVVLIPDLRQKQCCFDFGNLTRLPFGDSTLQVFQQRRHSHAQVAGTCDPFSKQCHVCRFADNTQEPCPTLPSWENTRTFTRREQKAV